MTRASAQLIKLGTARSDAITELEPPKHITGRSPAARRLLCGFRAPNCLSKPLPTNENWSADEHGSPEQLQRAEIVGALFELADADRDGQISMSELDMLLTLLEVPFNERPPTVLNFSANDTVTVEQFASLVGDRFIPPELTATWARTLASAFAEVDKDHSGALDAVEVRLALRRMGVNVSDEEFAEFFAYVDADGSGGITALELACAAPPARPNGSMRHVLFASGGASRPVPAVLRADGGAGNSASSLFDLSKAAISPSWAVDEDVEQGIGGFVADTLLPSMPNGTGSGVPESAGGSPWPRSAEVQQAAWRVHGAVDAKPSAQGSAAGSAAGRAGASTPALTAVGKTGRAADPQAGALEHLPIAERLAAHVILRFDSRPQPPSGRAAAAAPVQAEAAAASATTGGAAAGTPSFGAAATGRAVAAAAKQRPSNNGRGASPRAKSIDVPKWRQAEPSPSTLISATWPLRRRAVLLAFLAGCIASSITTFASPIADAMLGSRHAGGGSGGGDSDSTQAFAPGVPITPPPSPASVLGGGGTRHDAFASADDSGAASSNGLVAETAAMLWTQRGEALAFSRALRGKAAAGDTHGRGRALDERVSGLASGIATAKASIAGLTSHEYAHLALESLLLMVGSVAEVLCLYALALGAVMQVTRMVGLTLTPVDPERAFVISALARAALQLGNPTAPDTRYNIDPLRRASRLRLFVAALLWKGKAMLMTALVKLMLKRMLARAASEQLLQSASVPVIGICDAAVLHLALLDCLAVAQAPILTARMLDALVLRFGTARVKPPIRLALFRAIGCAIVRIEAHHPACALLLTHLERLVGRPLRTDVLDDEALFLAQLPSLQPHAQQLTLRLLFIALATDGMINPLERELLLKGARLCPAIDFARAEAAIDDMANALIDGRSLDVQVAFRLFPLSDEHSDDGGEDVNSDGLKQALCAGVCMRAATATMRAVMRAFRKAFKVIC